MAYRIQVSEHPRGVNITISADDIVWLRRLYRSMLRGAKMELIGLTLLRHGPAIDGLYTIDLLVRGIDYESVKKALSRNLEVGPFKTFINR